MFLHVEQILKLETLKSLYFRLTSFNFTQHMIHLQDNAMSFKTACIPICNVNELSTTAMVLLEEFEHIRCPQTRSLHNIIGWLSGWLFWA